MAAKDAPQEVIQKYKTILPKPIIELWKRHGFGGYSKGLFWTINPDTYLHYMKQWVDFYDYWSFSLLKVSSRRI